MWCLCCSSACFCGLVCRGGFTVLYSTVKPPRQTSPQAHCTVQRNHQDKPVHRHTVQYSENHHDKPVHRHTVQYSETTTANQSTGTLYNTVKPQRQTSPQAHADEQHKHCMNQMVVYIKKQLEAPLMMGLWEPETCRVKIKEINTQNKELHPLVTILQYLACRLYGIEIFDLAGHSMPPAVFRTMKNNCIDQNNYCKKQCLLQRLTTALET